MLSLLTKFLNFMVYLILAVLCGASLSVCFKIFRKIGIDTYQGVFVNYLTAIVVSLIMSGNGAESLGESIQAAIRAPWAWLAMIEGLFFMGGILVLAASTQRSGVAVTNVSARASLAIPVIVCYFAFNEQAPNWLAIILILLAMYLIFGNIGVRKEKFDIKDSLLPVAVFLTYGVCDFLLKYLKAQIGTDGNQGNIMLFIFSTAALYCIAAYIFRGHYTEHPFNWKAIPGGIILGLFNSFCTALMLKALGLMDASLFYPLYNVGVVFLSLLIGVLFFKEKLRAIQICGIVLASAAIVLLLM